MDTYFRSLKRYFLVEQGDFLSLLMDLCEEDLEKPVNEISPTRLNSLIELAIRTCSCSKIDPYKNDIYLQTGQEELALQIFKINSINTAHEKGKYVLHALTVRFSFVGSIFLTWLFFP